jgi:Tfp pilus assembly protein PilW
MEAMHGKKSAAVGEKPAAAGAGRTSTHAQSSRQSVRKSSYARTQANAAIVQRLGQVTTFFPPSHSSFFLSSHRASFFHPPPSL